MKTSLVILILTAGIASLAAQDRERPERPERPQRPDPPQIFASADTNEDGYLDLQEFTAFRENMPSPRGPRGPRGESAENDAQPAPQTEGQRGRGGRGGRGMPSAEDMFGMLDKNEDGKIAPEEFTLGNRRGRGGPGGGEGRRARPPQ